MGRAMTHPNTLTARILRNSSLDTNEKMFVSGCEEEEGEVDSEQVRR